jgi:hypothetical protein
VVAGWLTVRAESGSITSQHIATRVKAVNSDTRLTQADVVASSGLVEVYHILLDLCPSATPVGFSIQEVDC